MSTTQLSFFPRPVPPVIPGDVINRLKESILHIAETASRMTLSMTYLDPDNTPAQTIGTYLRNNLTSRLEDAFCNNKAPSLRAVVSGQKFRLDIDSADGITYRFPLHRCKPDSMVPTGAGALKKEVRYSGHQQSLLQQPPLGLFIGIIYHEEKGLREIFLGQLFATEHKNKYRTDVLSTLYRSTADYIDAGKITEHEAEDVAEPIVTLRKK